MDDSTSGPAAALQASREDSRPRIPEPPPVSLVAVRDVRLPAIAGLEPAMDEFYRDLLRFERVDEPADSGEGVIYRAENHDLCFYVVEVPPDRQCCRPLGIVSPHFGEILEQLESAGLAFERVPGLFAGDEGILLQDPSGNWITLAPRREFR